MNYTIISYEIHYDKFSFLMQFIPQKEGTLSIYKKYFMTFYGGEHKKYIYALVTRDGMNDFITSLCSGQ